MSSNGTLAGAGTRLSSRVGDSKGFEVVRGSGEDAINATGAPSSWPASVCSWCSGCSPGCLFERPSQCTSGGVQVHSRRALSHLRRIQAFVRRWEGVGRREGSFPLSTGELRQLAAELARRLAHRLMAWRK